MLCGIGAEVEEFGQHYQIKNLNDNLSLLKSASESAKINKNLQMALLFLIGFCYLNQLGVKNCQSQAYDYFSKAASLAPNSAYAVALNWIGDCYYYGIGLSQNFQEA